MTSHQRKVEEEEDCWLFCCGGSLIQTTVLTLYTTSPPYDCMTGMFYPKPGLLAVDLHVKRVGRLPEARVSVRPPGHRIIKAQHHVFVSV